MDLINALNTEQDVKKCKEIAEKLKTHLIKQANEDLKWNKIGGWASGIIPFFDILIQHYIKKNAKKKISEKFDDNLTDLEQKKSYITKDEKDNVDEVKKQKVGALYKIAGFIAFIMLGYLGIRGYKASVEKLKINGCVDQISELVRNIQQAYRNEYDYGTLDYAQAVSLRLIPQSMFKDGSREALNSFMGGIDIYFSA